jgi:hypothetical protein
MNQLERIEKFKPAHAPQDIAVGAGGYRAGQAKRVIERGQDDAFDVALGHFRNDFATARDGSMSSITMSGEYQYLGTSIFAGLTSSDLARP